MPQCSLISYGEPQRALFDLNGFNGSFESSGFREVGRGCQAQTTLSSCIRGQCLISSAKFGLFQQMRIKGPSCVALFMCRTRYGWYCAFKGRELSPVSNQIAIIRSMTNEGIPQLCVALRPPWEAFDAFFSSMVPVPVRSSGHVAFVSVP